MHTAKIVDTDVIIDCLRNYTPAIHYIVAEKNPYLVSAITVAELFAGVRSESEKTRLESTLSSFQVISIDKNIAETGGFLREKYGKSHGTGIMDALIAATALHNEATLITLNTRHFPMVKTIKPYDKTL